MKFRAEKDRLRESLKCLSRMHQNNVAAQTVVLTVVLSLFVSFVGCNSKSCYVDCFEKTKDGIITKTPCSWVQGSICERCPKECAGSGITPFYEENTYEDKTTGTKRSCADYEFCNCETVPDECKTKTPNPPTPPKQVTISDLSFCYVKTVEEQGRYATGSYVKMTIRYSSTDAMTPLLAVSLKRGTGSFEALEVAAVEAAGVLEFSYLYGLADTDNQLTLKIQVSLTSDALKSDSREQILPSSIPSSPACCSCEGQSGNGLAKQHIMRQIDPPVDLSASILRTETGAEATVTFRCPYRDRTVLAKVQNGEIVDVEALKPDYFVIGWDFKENRGIRSNAQWLDELQMNGSASIFVGQYQYDARTPTYQSVQARNLLPNREYVFLAKSMNGPGSGLSKAAGSILCDNASTCVLSGGTDGVVAIYRNVVLKVSHIPQGEFGEGCWAAAAAMVLKWYSPTYSNYNPDSPQPGTTPFPLTVGDLFNWTWNSNSSGGQAPGAHGLPMHNKIGSYNVLSSKAQPNDPAIPGSRCGECQTELCVAPLPECHGFCYEQEPSIFVAYDPSCHTCCDTRGMDSPSDWYVGYDGKQEMCDNRVVLGNDNTHASYNWGVNCMLMLAKNKFTSATGLVSVPTVLLGGAEESDLIDDKYQISSRELVDYISSGRAIIVQHGAVALGANSHNVVIYGYELSSSGRADEDMVVLYIDPAETVTRIAMKHAAFSDFKRAIIGLGPWTQTLVPIVTP